MSFGFSFGKKKSSGVQTLDSTVTTDLSGSQNSSSTQAGTTNTTTTGTTSSTGTQQGVNTTNQSNTQSGSTQQTGLTTSLGADVVSALSDSARAVLSGGLTAQNISGLSDMITGRQGFDSEGYVTDTVNAARTRGEQVLQEQNSAFASNIGGTAGTNSMAALLAARGSNDLEASLAGIRAQATGQAESIQNQNLGAAIQAQTGLAGISAALAEAAKGGTTTTDITSLTSQISELLGRDTSLQQTQQQASSSETSQTNQLLAQIQEILTQQREVENTDSTATSRGSSGGFGFSLGL